MHAHLRTTLAAAVLVAAVPAAGIASAHDGKGKGEGRGEASSKRCDRGKGYEAKGLLAAGSVLEQVAGADTARRSDDRFSGTVVIQVKQGNKRGRGDKGLTSFAVSNVRALGTVAGDEPLPEIGTRVQVVGRLAKRARRADDAEPLASRAPRRAAADRDPAGRDDVEPSTAADEPRARTTRWRASAGVKVSPAVIALVIFKPSRDRVEPCVATTMRPATTERATTVATTTPLEDRSVPSRSRGPAASVGGCDDDDEPIVCAAPDRSTMTSRTTTVAIRVRDRTARRSARSRRRGPRASIARGA